jgi:aryl-alcohol dehydrogenase-like predicted oxidoreductase
MSTMNRRSFLSRSAGVAALLSPLRPLQASAQETISRPPQVPLGKTGITVSRVAQGCGMSGGNRNSNHSRLGFQKLVNLLRHGYERGITFYDMADLYGTHVYFREALRSIPRDKVVILSKLWWRYDRGGQGKAGFAATQKHSARLAIERFRHEISTDYLDILLLHCLSSPTWDQELAPYMEVLDEAKAKKQIRAVGVSCHSLGALRKAAECPWVDVVMARINPKGAKMDGKPEEVIPILKQMKKNGKAVIGMKIYGEGTLAHMKDECIEFAQDLGLLDAMTIGAESTSQLDETLRLLSRHPAAPVS